MLAVHVCYAKIFSLGIFRIVQYLFIIPEIKAKLMDTDKFFSYILPTVSVILICVFLTNPNITGFIVLNQTKILKAEIKIILDADGFIPEGSVVTVSLNNENSSMNIEEFISKSGEYNYIYGTLSDINYTGYGYSGSGTYIVDLSEFNINRKLASGNYTLVTRIIYNSTIISEGKKDIVIW